MFAAGLLAAPTHDLVAAASASGRPQECTVADSAATRATRGNRSQGSWAQARLPKLNRYCHLISRAQARLERAPDSARAAALEADKLVPNRAASQVVLARTALRLGRIDEALSAFDLALQRDPHSVDQPLAMHDLATAQWRGGRHVQALATYRMLVPRVDLMGSRSKRARVLLEAAHLAMHVIAQGGSASLDETLAYLREAARDPHQELQIDVALSLVLALDRAGKSTQADALLGDIAATSWVDGADPTALHLSADHFAMLALALERSDRQRADAFWQRFLDQHDGKWHEVAARRRERLSRR